ncbi:hypothetical protein Tdes44962_MAKER08410 [Teratosphaeria destructans]|uniref:Uncharacterized protein n=1 Tax=Teratosphaeria destructans TaxID=418781 RepID=A0A9W7W4I1_9PEZI|nr:hypothetical protein Tdes44962_MAKER08410 [Teratosphaeria destructans]
MGRSSSRRPPAGTVTPPVVLKSVLPSTFASCSQPRLDAESKGATNQTENEAKFKWLDIDGERALGRGEAHQNAYEMWKGTWFKAKTRRDSSISSSSQTPSRAV